MNDEDMIEECMEIMLDGGYTDWEEDFLYCVEEMIGDGEDLTDAQSEKLREIHERGFESCVEEPS